MTINNLSVYEMMKTRRSNQYCADRLNITLEEYLDRKGQVLETLQNCQTEIDAMVANRLLGLFDDPQVPETSPVEAIAYHENYDADEATHTLSVAVLPKTTDEIIKLLKLDTREWRLSQVWNKQKKDRWEISALVSRLKGEKKKEVDVLEFLTNLKTLPAYKPKEFKLRQPSDKPRMSGVISLQDLHFGKPGNEAVGELMFNACVDLVETSEKVCQLDKIYLVLGSDTLNVDTFNNTTTKGTIVEQSEHPTLMYEKAFEACYKMILYLAEHCDEVKVVFIPGNHDRLSSFHLLHALSKVLQHHPLVSFDVEYKERKAYIYGKSLLCFEHGDVAKSTTPLTYATEFAHLWGSASYRYLYSGHLHKKKTTEVVTENEESGFILKILPSLSASDYYHYHNKWTGNAKAAVIELHDQHYGKRLDYTHVVPAA